MILGIDQSFSSCGLCLNDGKDFNFKVISTKPDKDDPLEKFKRATVIANEIIDLCFVKGVKTINIEGLALGGNMVGSSNRDLAGLQYVIITKILDKLESGVIINIIAPTSLKKHATGKGNAKKEMLYECLPTQIKEELDCIPKSKGRLDLCDAYWLSTYIVDKT